MEPAPLPPHERSWRHPSELAPTVSDVDRSTGGRNLVLVTGTAAAVLVVMLVVALTPPPSSAPTAISSTTLPSVSARDPNAARSTVERAQGIVQLERSSVTQESVLTLSGSPNAISAAPDAATSDLQIARSVPDPNDRVILLTGSHTYNLRWHQVALIADAPDGAVVMTRSGELIAVLVDGDVDLLVP